MFLTPPKLSSPYCYLFLKILPIMTSFRFCFLLNILRVSALPCNIVNMPPALGNVKICHPHAALSTQGRHNVTQGKHNVARAALGPSALWRHNRTLGQHNVFLGRHTFPDPSGRGGIMYQGTWTQQFFLRVYSMGLFLIFALSSSGVGSTCFSF